MLNESGWTMLSRRAEPAAERAAVAAAKAPAARKGRWAGMAMAGGQPPAKRKTPPVVSKYFHGEDWMIGGYSPFFSRHLAFGKRTKKSKLKINSKQQKVLNYPNALSISKNSSKNME
jgi:hypothetical protein